MTHFGAVSARLTDTLVNINVAVAAERWICDAVEKRALLVHPNDMPILTESICKPSNTTASVSVV